MAIDSTGARIEDVEDFGEESPDIVKRWVTEIRLAEKEYAKWTKAGKKIVKRYRDERKGQDDIEYRKPSRFNIFWSNVQTLQPALYSRTPKPEVGRRYKDKDPVARAASEILERCLEYSLDVYDFDEVMQAVRDDNLIVGRGQAWIRYVPHIEVVNPPARRVERLWQISPETGEEEYKFSFEDGSPFDGDPSLINEGPDGEFVSQSRSEQDYEENQPNEHNHK